MSDRKQVSMRLPDGVKVLKKNLYRNFKKRAKRHSSFLYRDKGKRPPLFRIHKIGSVFDSSIYVLIVRKTYEVIYDSTIQANEIGFKVVFRHSNGDYGLLTVLKQGKAYYEPCETPKMKN